MRYLCIYLVAVNIAAFFLFGLDKQKARKHRYRIPEDVLLLFAVLGGSIGAVLGMKLFHHKTLHNKFRIGLPVIFLIQAGLGTLFYLL